MTKNNTKSISNKVLEFVSKPKFVKTTVLTTAFALSGFGAGKVYKNICNPSSPPTIEKVDLKKNYSFDKISFECNPPYKLF
jgi:hypothetical protein